MRSVTLSRLFAGVKAAARSQDGGASARTSGPAGASAAGVGAGVVTHSVSSPAGTDATTGIGVPSLGPVVPEPVFESSRGTTRGSRVVASRPTPFAAGYPSVSVPRAATGMISSAVGRIARADDLPSQIFHTAYALCTLPVIIALYCAIWVLATPQRFAFTVLVLLALAALDGAIMQVHPVH